MRWREWARLSRAHSWSTYQARLIQDQFHGGEYQIGTEGRKAAFQSPSPRAASRKQNREVRRDSREGRGSDNSYPAPG
jgi:hypothetical protein